MRRLPVRQSSADAASAAPHFRVEPVENAAVSYALPPWLEPGAPVDPLADAPLPAALDGSRLTITLPPLDAFRLVWILNEAR